MKFYIKNKQILYKKISIYVVWKMKIFERNMVYFEGNIFSMYWVYL